MRNHDWPLFDGPLWVDCYLLRETVDYQRSRGRRAAGLDLCLLGDLEGVIDLDPEISYGAFELGMSKQ
jgi:hypothetical protein